MQHETRLALARTLAVVGPLVGCLGVGCFVLGAPRTGWKWLAFGWIFLSSSILLGFLSFAMGNAFWFWFNYWAFGTGPLVFLVMGAICALAFWTSRIPSRPAILALNVLVPGTHLLWAAEGVLLRRVWPQLLLAVVGLSVVCIHVEGWPRLAEANWAFSLPVLVLYVGVGLLAPLRRWNLAKERPQAGG